jgi:LysM repeat protein
MKNSPQSVIDSYKRRQKIMPWVIGILAILLVVAGVTILVLSLGQGGSLFAPPPTATPTATSTKIVLPPTATVPPPTATLTSTQTLTPTFTVTSTPNGPVEYTVQDKDTCWDLAIKFKVDLAALLALNNFPAGTCPIQPGQKIMIPAPGQTLPTATPMDVSKLLPGTVINYTLQLGDSLRDLAIRFHSTQDSIKNLNSSIITDVNKLVAGQTIKIQVNIATPVPTTVPSSTASTKPASTTTSTVVPATATKNP